VEWDEAARLGDSKAKGRIADPIVTILNPASISGSVLEVDLGLTQSYLPVRALDVCEAVWQPVALLVVRIEGGDSRGILPQRVLPSTVETEPVVGLLFDPFGDFDVVLDVEYPIRVVVDLLVVVAVRIQ
jgi:hypothetical protein